MPLKIKKRHLKKITSRVAQSGFGFLVHELKLAHLLPYGAFRRLRPAGAHSALPDAAAVARLVTELGPGFVELARIAASRSDLVPARFQNALLNLKPDPLHPNWADVRRILGASFTHLEPEPHANNALGHTWRAALSDGRRVLVTVNDPNAVRRFLENADAIHHLAPHVLGRLGAHARGAWQGVLEAFEDRSKSLTDFTAQAARIEIVREQFSGNKKVVIPQVYWEHTNPNVLVCSWSRLPSLRDVAEGRHKVSGSKKYLARYLADAFVFQYGVGGYMLLRPMLNDFQIAPGNRVVFEHPGLVTYLPPETRTWALLFIWLLLEDQWELAAKTLLHVHYAASHEQELHRLGGLVLRRAEGEGVSEKLWPLLAAAWSGGLSIPLGVTQVCESILFLEHLVVCLDREIDFSDALRAAIKKQAPALFDAKRNAAAKAVATDLFSRR